MRFHIGFSKRISVKTLIEILGFLFVGVLAFFGLTQHAYAETNGNVAMVPNAMYFHTNSSGADVSPTNFGSHACSFDSSKTCFYMYGFNVNAFSPQDFNFIYNSKNLCSNNNNLSSITLRGIMQSPAGTNVRGNLQAYEAGSSLANVSMEFQSNNVFTITVKYDTSKQLRLRFNSSLSDSSIYYMELTNSNYYTCDYTIQDSTQDITNNANQNTENIINNQNQNTQDILNNQNQNTQDLMDSQKVCKSLNITSNSCITNGYLDNDGTLNTANTTFCVTDYYELDNSSTIKLLDRDSNGGRNFCFYNSSKQLISCSYVVYTAVGSYLSIPSNSKYVRFTIWKNNNLPKYEFYSCKNGNQAIVDSNNQLNDSINNSDVTGAGSAGGHFFDDFNNRNDPRGFANIATAPLRLLQAVLNSADSCTPLSIPLGMNDGTFSGSSTLVIPCGDILWSKAPSSIISVWNILIFGVLAYRLLIDMVKFVNNILNPEYSKEYFLDL